MLFELEAFALIDRHCRPLRVAKWIGPGFDHGDDWADAVCERVSLIVEPNLTDETTRHDALLEGARLRLALGVAQAVSCCRRVEPATNQSFWRHVVEAYWPKTGYGVHASRHLTDTMRHDQIAVAPATFMHVGIQWVRTCAAHDAFWIGFFHGMPAESTQLRSVLDQLASHFAAGVPPPPLRASLSRCFAQYPDGEQWRRSDQSRLPKVAPADPVVSPPALQTILRAALDTSTTHWSVATRVGLVVDYSINDYYPAATHEMLDLVKRARIESPPYLELAVDRLAIQLSPPPRLMSARLQASHNLALFVARGRPLGELLRWFLTNEAIDVPRVHTVAVLGCSRCTFRLVGAVLSAVALASPPITELRCSGVFDVAHPKDQLMRIAWLTYALHRRQRHVEGIVGPRRAPLALSLQAFGVAMTDRESEYMRQLLELGTPLRDVVGAALRLRFGGKVDTVAQLHVECLRDGATVRLVCGSRLYFEPFRLTDDCVALEVGWTAADEELDFDLIAHVVEREACGFVGVVVAGYGLVWAEAACVIAGHDASDKDGDVEMTGGDGGQRAGGVDLSSLALSFELPKRALPRDVVSVAYRVAATLPLLASASLRALSLDRVVLSRADFVAILQYFPSLESLALARTAIVSIEPLLDAYSTATAQVPTARPAVLLLSRVYDVQSLEVQRRSDSPFKAGSVAIYEAHNEVGAAGPARKWFERFVDALALGLAAGRLRELHVEFYGTDYYHERTLTWRLAGAVASAAHAQFLRRLHVSYHVRESLLGMQELAPLRDGRVAVYPLLPRVRCAVLSVLRAVNCCVRSIAESVLAMAEQKSARVVTWCDSVSAISRREEL